MKAVSLSIAEEFIAYAGPSLATDEVRYGLIDSIVRRLGTNPHIYGPDDPWFCVVTEGALVCAVAMRTPPLRVLLAHFTGEPLTAAQVIVDEVSRHFVSIPGVVGDLELADPFAAKWCATHSVHVEQKMAQRIYRLDKVADIFTASGYLRFATLADKELLTKWRESFYLDVNGTAALVPAADITPTIENKGVYVWEDGVPVSMAIGQPSGPKIIVSGVYTPPELRRRGYATSCVAAICTRLLAAGYKLCMLYTDLANPTSNSIYKKIGFKEVCDSVEFSFSRQG